MKHSITATVNKGIISLIKRALFCGVTLFLSLSIYAQDIEQEKIDHFIDYIEQNNRAVGSISIFKGIQKFITEILVSKIFRTYNLTNIPLTR
ncbi:hypothetical protein QW060_21850 [Myroides ceti]|uniref:Uncharacterized protein n=1 Tax=Paenimyroides ceti TaxID=395087 RepID=A0ABT8D2Z7_9FLAO|nr:hypothetical protein [Paenimyroides ceti]MDN3709614.1 hypothetical protein [Paenimyroides ceti]